MTPRRALKLFQFQTGAIKSDEWTEDCPAPASFNSKLVRLKVQVMKNQTLSMLLFQFQTGAIKRMSKKEYRPLYEVSIPNWCD